MHGAVVMGAVFALVADQEDSTSRVAVAAAVVLVVYWLTHAYTAALGSGIGGDRTHLVRRLLRCGRRETAVLLGGLPAVLTFSLSLALGADFSRSVNAALWLTFFLLAAVGYLAAHAAGITGWRLAGETSFAAVVGGSMVALNTLLH
jgi:hypothetical protein